MTEEERAALRKGDEIDDISTSDLEDAKEDNEEFLEVSHEFLEHNRVNLARAFLGKDGGYSIRKLKKFMIQDQIRRQLEEEQEKLMGSRDEEDEEEGEEVEGDEVKAAADKDQNAAAGVEGEEG